MSRHTDRSKVRVLILEDHVLFAESLELALNVEGYSVHRLSPPAEPTSPKAIVAAVLRMRPHIVLLDLDLGPFGDGARVIRPLTEAGVKIVVVTASSDQARWGECVRNGARKVLGKTRPLNEILATIRRLSEGVPVMTREERDELIAVWQRDGRERAAVQEKLKLLTPREEAVLAELMRGHTVREIATEGVVSEATVRTQVKSILAKLEVSSQLAAVGMAINNSWHPRAE